MGRISRFAWMLTRRKPMEVSDDMPTDFHRCLNTLDLTAMGVGATLGFGLYVLTGEVAADKAGPGVILSFMIAAVASTFSALCYAEFAAKVPKSGSAYAYSYITVGEFVAFIIGWNLMLEHVIGTAALARGYSGYLATLVEATREHNQNSSLSSISQAYGAVPTPPSPSVPHLPSPAALMISGAVPSDAAPTTALFADLVTGFDWTAFMLTVLVTGLLLLGVQVSSKFQIIFAAVNLSVACFIFGCGLTRADFKNWNLSPEADKLPESAGSGGFLPFGISGVIAGAGSCFFAFVGFDGIAATAEEVKNPRKAIPNSIIWTSIIIFFTYCGIATVQTLIWPYYDQKQAAPLPYIFDKLDMPFAKWTVLFGVLAGLSTCFVGGFLPLPRIMYAMARDGVIYRVLSKISKRFKVPFVSTIVGGIIIALLASTLEVSQLADMLSIGTLAAYSLVSISVLLLRFEYRKPKQRFSLPLIPTDARLKACKLAAINQLNASHLLLPPTTLSTNTNNDNFKNTQPKLDQSECCSQDASTRTSMSICSENSNNSTEQQTSLSLNSDEPSSRSSCTASNNTSQRHHQSPISKSPTSAEKRREISRIVAAASIRRPLMQVFWQGPCARLPDEQSTKISRVLIVLLVVMTTLLDLALVIWGPVLSELDPIITTIVTLPALSSLLLTFLLNRLPMTAPSKDSFEVPLVPGIPLFSVVINSYLMLNLSVMTWLRFAVWMAIGFFIYFTYGIFNSTGYKDSRCD